MHVLTFNLGCQDMSLDGYQHIYIVYLVRLELVDSSVQNLIKGRRVCLEIYLYGQSSSRVSVCRDLEVDREHTNRRTFDV